MTKRPHTYDDSEYPSKRLRPCRTDRLSPLSDELLLRTLSFLPISDLTLCQRLSRRLEVLAGDAQLWKSAYYDRFVRPRASRIPGLRDKDLSAQSLYYSSKISKWLEDDHLVRGGRATNWKRQYKLRHNWSRGSCNVSETQVADRPSIPPLLVRFHEGILVSADSAGGLRAWLMKGNQRLVASMLWPSDDLQPGSSAAPTSLAIDVSNHNTDRMGISIGFTDGKFGIYQLNKADWTFVRRYTHAPSSNGTISAIAYASPYLLTMTEAQLLSLYVLKTSPSVDPAIDDLAPPRLLSSLKSHTAWPPLSLAVRVSPTNIFASIAYAMPRYLAGWSVGLQELRLTSEGSILESRLASALSQGFTPLSNPRTRSSSSSPIPGSSPTRSTDVITSSPLTRPTSLSYNHPYLLAAHPDNTLTLYMVTSNAEDLSIGHGKRLWGHTSSVSGAHVGDRGRAVSVSARGNELRVWELEGGLLSNASKRRVAAGEVSVQVRAETTNGVPLGHIDPSSAHSQLDADTEMLLEQNNEDLAVTKGWVGFDDEKVVVLREKLHGTQALVVYDFT